MKNKEQANEFAYELYQAINSYCKNAISKKELDSFKERDLIKYVTGHSEEQIMKLAKQGVEILPERFFNVSYKKRNEFQLEMAKEIILYASENKNLNENKIYSFLHSLIEKVKTVKESDFAKEREDFAQNLVVSLEEAVDESRGFTKERVKEIISKAVEALPSKFLKVSTNKKRDLALKMAVDFNNYFYECVDAKEAFKSEKLNVFLYKLIENGNYEIAGIKTDQEIVQSPYIFPKNVDLKYLRDFPYENDLGESYTMNQYVGVWKKYLNELITKGSLLSINPYNSGSIDESHHAGRVTYVDSYIKAC
jgi:hypothetical protein